MRKIDRRSALSAALGAGIVAFGRPSGSRAAAATAKFGHNLPVESPLHVNATQMWAAVARETGGQLVVEVYPNSALGGDTAMLTQLRSGALEFQAISGPLISSVVPVAAIENVPFAFGTIEDAWKATDGTLGAHVRAQIEAKGIHALETPFEIGLYQITNSVRPLRDVSDVAGMKMRTGASKLAVDTFKSLGASPAPMSLAEVYTSLQTHVVDGQYNPYATIEVARFYEVQKYVSQVNFAYGNYWCIVNADFWTSLGPRVQGIVQRNATKYGLLQRRDNELLSQACADKLVRQGMIRNVADASTFRAKLVEAGFYARWKDEFGAHAWSLLETYSGKLG